MEAKPMDLATTLSTFWDRIWTIARNVFLEVVRDRILYVVGVFGVIMVMAITLLPEVAAGTEDKIILDTGLAAINILSLFVVVFIGTGLINKEIEKKTVLVLIAKPVSRSEFILGKHLGLSLVMAVLVGSLTFVMLSLLALVGVPYDFGDILLAMLFMFLEMVLLIAAALMFGVITSTVLATLMTLSVFAVGHETCNMLRAAQGQAASEIFQRVAKILFVVLPDLEHFNLKNEAAHGFVVSHACFESGSGSGLFQAFTETFAGSAMYGLAYTVVLLSITILVFESRQF